MLKIGITGGIGSGKSVISKIFQVFGIPVYNSDLQAKDLMQRDALLKKGIISIFGRNSYLQSGALNTGHISKIAFENKNKLEELNSLVHPAVGRDFTNWVKKQSTKYVLKEAALLIETGLFKDLDKLILVIAPRELRIERVLKRDPKRTENQVRSIMNSQMDDDLKKNLSFH